MRFLPVDAATVRLPREGNAILGAVRVVSGSEIKLRYRHSVEKTMVEGVFRIGSGPVLQAKETRMTSVGTGLPNTRTATTRREGQWIVVDEGLTSVPAFDFFISALSADMMETNGENSSTIKYCAALCGCPRTAPNSGTLNCVFNVAFASMPSGRLGIENTNDCCSALHSIASSGEALSLQPIA